MIYAEMIVISNGNIEKEFLECDELPEENLNNGKILENISSWIGIAEFVDNDELSFSEIRTGYIF